MPTPSLHPYLSRLVREWDDVAPGALHRAIEGSMVMVDVSGFTSMSERLARHGKVGAEEVTEVIGSTFERLLAEAYAFGATLVKFGGDALLLFFRGEGHPQRACCRRPRDASRSARYRGVQDHGGPGTAADVGGGPYRDIRLLHGG